jgi:hypothetical protein
MDTQKAIIKVSNLLGSLHNRLFYKRHIILKVASTTFHYLNTTEWFSQCPTQKFQ